MAGRRLRVGLIGGGFGIRSLLPAIRRAGATVTAFCHPEPAKAFQLAIELQVPAWETSARAVALRQDVDLVWIASPPAFHYAQTMESLRAGKHVICEKPLATSAQQAREMLDEAVRRNLVHVVDHEFRFVRRRSVVKGLLSQAAIGRVRVASVIDHSSRLHDRRKPTPEWWLRRDMAGGQLGAVGSHWVDTLRWWLGEVVEVWAALAVTYTERATPEGRRVRVTADDTFALTLAFDSGAIATVQSSCVTSEAFCDVRLYGEKGSIVMGDGGDLVLARANGRPRVLLRATATPRVSGASGLEELEALSEVLRDTRSQLQSRSGVGTPRKESSNATFYDGLRVQEVLDRAYALRPD